MSKKLAIKKQLADLKSKMLELNKQLKREEDAERLKVGEIVIAMYKSGNLNLVSLEAELKKIIGNMEEEVEEKLDERLSSREDSQIRSISNEDR
jgi:ArsR family metal-binding transcriptional regulator